MTTPRPFSDSPSPGAIAATEAEYGLALDLHFVWPRAGQVPDTVFAAALRQILTENNFGWAALAGGLTIVVFGEPVRLEAPGYEATITARGERGVAPVRSEEPSPEEWESVVDAWELARRRATW